MSLSSEFPIPKPFQLPTRISPCPIVEAVVEIRFVSTESWRNLPGMFHPRIRERYPEQKELPLASMPDELRSRDPAFTWLPILQYGGVNLNVQFGPRVLSLVTRAHHYPGWTVLEQELTWLFARLQESGIVSETERIGLRYVDFFENDVWPQLKMGVRIDGDPLVSGELSTTVVLRHPEGHARLQVANGAFFQEATGVKRGSVLDLDVWHPGGEDDLFADGLDRVRRLHQASKEIFFGLLKPNFLNSLNPEYPTK